MKILTIDIETSPNIGHVWSLWKQNISLSQLQESGEVISFAAKWYGEGKVEFRSNFHDGHEEMVKRAHALLDGADAVVTYNGTTFDGPFLKSEFAKAGLFPPSPYKDIDLLRVVKKNFRFPSNKLQYVSTALGLEGKVSHSGHELWVRCMAGDPKAWATMKRYNMQDTRLTEKLYDRLRPWVQNHPHMGLYEAGEGADCCSRCGSEDLERRGYAYTGLGKYRQYQCRACGAWSRGKKAIAMLDVRGVS